MTEPVQARECGKCEFVALTENELQEHFVETGHKRLGFLRLILRLLGEWLKYGIRDKDSRDDVPPPAPGLDNFPSRRTRGPGSL